VPDEPRTVDLNADLGEANDDAGTAIEQALLGLVTTAHIACGGHAGDERSMAKMVRAALAAGVRVGAHPSYPDRVGFGRRPVEMAAPDLAVALGTQINALVAVAASVGAEVSSIKPHGALYAEVAHDPLTFDALRDAFVRCCGPDAALVLASGSPAVAWARQAGVAVFEEGFVDRAYTGDGALVARHEPGSVYSDPERAASQALGLAARGTVAAEDGTQLALHVDTLCLHGDSPNAPAMARAVRAALGAAGVVVAAPPAHRH
jgi:UPF0271 protein